MLHHHVRVALTALLRGHRHLAARLYFICGMLGYAEAFDDFASLQRMPRWLAELSLRAHYSLDSGSISSKINVVARLHAAKSLEFGRLALRSARLNDTEGIYNYGVYLLARGHCRAARRAFKYLAVRAAQHWAHQLMGFIGHVRSVVQC